MSHKENNIETRFPKTEFFLTEDDSMVVIMFCNLDEEEYKFLNDNLGKKVHKKLFYETENCFLVLRFVDLNIEYAVNIIGKEMAYEMYKNGYKLAFGFKKKDGATSPEVFLFQK